MQNNINPFDILSGKVAINHYGSVFYFKEAGNNMRPDGCPIEDKLHRENDLPAIIYAGGQTEWWINGYLHRENDLPAIIWDNGSKFWYKNGKRHRENDLPAIEYNNGHKEWFEYGRRHRNGGLPAITQPDGTQRFYYNGVEYYPNLNSHIFTK